MNSTDHLTITPIDLPNESFCSLVDLIRHHAASYRDALALREGESRFTWGELATAMERMAGALEGQGFGPGDVLAILSEPTADCMVSFLGALAAGGCAAPLPAIASDAALKTMTADSGAKLLLASATMAERALQLVCESATLRQITLLGIDFAAHGWPDLRALARAVHPSPAPVEVPPDALFNIIYSSGTTGVPKGIVHDHLFRYRQLLRMREFGLAENCTMLVSTAIYSNTTLVPAMAALGNGGALVMMRKFSAGDFLDLVEKARPTHVMLVPVQVQRILAHPRFASADLSSIVSTIVTSSPFSPQVKKRAVDSWPGALYEMYGLTEGGLTSMLNTARYPDKLASVGIPSRAARLRILDANDNEVAPGEVGEVVGRSPTMMRGYHGRPDLTEKALVRLLDGETYFRTGDLGRLDEDGFLYIVGRAKDVIISGGFNIYATDLEDMLLAHPTVLEAAVIGAPSPEWGETPVGFVVLQPGQVTSGDELRAFANAKLGKAQRLAEVRIVEQLPLNALGKVVKAELKARFDQAPNHQAG